MPGTTLLRAVSSQALRTYWAMRLLRGRTPPHPAGGFECALATLAVTTGLSESTVATARRELVVLDLISSPRRGLWIILPDRDWLAPPPRGSPAPPPEPVSASLRRANSPVSASLRRASAPPGVSASLRRANSGAEPVSASLRRANSPVSASLRRATLNGQSGLNVNHGKPIPPSPSSPRENRQGRRTAFARARTRALLPSGPALPLHEEVQLLDRARRILGVTQYGTVSRYSQRIRALLRQRVRERYTPDQLLRVLAYARDRWDQGDRFHGYKDLLWLWGTKFPGHLAAAEATAEVPSRLVYRSGEAMSTWQRDVEEAVRRQEAARHAAEDPDETAR